MDPIEIFKISQKDFNQVVEDFCYDVDLFLSPHQMSKYINDIIKRANEEAEDYLLKNKEFYDEYMKQEIISLENDLISVDELINNYSYKFSEDNSLMINKGYSGLNSMINTSNSSQVRRNITKNY